MDSGGGLLPDWLTAVFAVAGAVATGAAAVWAWLVKERSRLDREQAAKRSAEEKRFGVPFAQLVQKMEAQLEKANQGFDRLQTEHADVQVKLARCEERDAYNGRRLTQLEEEVARHRERLGEGGQ